MMVPTEAEIRQRSYFIWQREGCPAGCDWNHWFRAIAELEAEEAAKAEKGAASGVRPKRARSPAKSAAGKSSGPAPSATRSRKE